MTPRNPKAQNRLRPAVLQLQPTKKARVSNACLGRSAPQNEGEKIPSDLVLQLQGRDLNPRPPGYAFVLGVFSSFLNVSR